VPETPPGNINRKFMILNVEVGNDKKAEIK
jgi:hypothetical protein